jgi:hypothetical protein
METSPLLSMSIDAKRLLHAAGERTPASMPFS